jgi:hypothetical protein
VSDDTAELAGREQRLIAELEQVQRELRALFPPNAEALRISDPRRIAPLGKDERARLHQRREEIRVELEEVRGRRAICDR